jgi:hypothetical protein
MTPRRSSALRALAPWRSAISTIRRRRMSPLAATMAIRPATMPSNMRPASSLVPSAMRLWDAPSISPAAAPLATLSHQALILRTNRNGTAPRPVTSAVMNAARNTEPILASIVGLRLVVALPQTQRYLPIARLRSVA